MPTTMGTQIGVPPVPELVGGGVVWPEDDVATGVGVAAVVVLTVKTKAPWSGSPSSAETVIHCTTKTPLLLSDVVLMGIDISLGFVNDTEALPWLISSPLGP